MLNPSSTSLKNHTMFLSMVCKCALHLSPHTQKTMGVHTPIYQLISSQTGIMECHIYFNMILYKQKSDSYAHSIHRKERGAKKKHVIFTECLHGFQNSIIINNISLSLIQMIGNAVSGMLSIQFSPRAPQAEPSFYSFMFTPYFSPLSP